MPPEMNSRKPDLKERPGIVAAPARVFGGESDKVEGYRKSVLQSGDPEAVHDLRISIRKIRTAIRLFWPILSTEARSLDVPLQELFRSLGEVRNLDIAIAASNECSPDLRWEIRNRLQESRAKANEVCLLALQTTNVLDTLLAIPDPVSLIPKAGVLDGETHPIRVTNRQAVKSFRKVEKSWETSEVHRLRRRIKRFRYALEFFAPEIGSDAKVLVKRLKDLQDVLGSTIDLVTLSHIYAQLPGLSPAADAEAKHRAKQMAQRARETRNSLPDCKGVFAGTAWKRLETQLN